jgi:LPXTG-motif cell wall-anchored protein
MILAVVVAMAATAGPALAQAEDKAAARAAKKADRQAARAAKQAQKAAPADTSAKKALPATGGIPAGTVALLGSGALIVGGGLVVHRAVRR